MSRLINIACGDSYVPEWENYDYQPCSASVRKADLLGVLPILSNDADVIYSSHFFEHIPRSNIDWFLSECFRIARPGGKLRLVLPDFEEMCSAYLQYRRAGEHEKADFLALEILDQCVRQTPGGELGELYEKLGASDAENKALIQFVRQRTGHKIGKEIEATSKRPWRSMASPRMIWNRFERFYIRAVLGLLPPAFRKQNVSTATVGERHAWLYDFYSVEKLLRKAGFVEIRRVSPTTSSIPGFPFFPLDVYEDGSPRKGVESMYVEATKP